MTHGTLRRVATLVIAVVVALGVSGSRTLAHAQGGNDLGGLWRGPTAPAVRTVDSVALKHVADSVKAATAKRVADSVKAQTSRKTQDSVTARAQQLDQVVRTQSDSIARLRAALVALAAPEKETQKDSAKKELKVAGKEELKATAKEEQKATAKDVVKEVPTSTAATVATLAARIDSLQAAQRAAVKQAADAEQKLAQRVSGLGNFRFSGDVRVRYDGISQSGGVVTRHRERSRVRLGISGNLSDELTGLIGIASGAVEDVQSPNQTQTGFFTRKSIGFDRFFLNYKPKAVPGLSIIGGKFAYPWERSALTFGNDINPEGIASSWALNHKGVFQGVTAAGFVLPLLEVAGGKDSYISGAQLQTRWKPSPHTTARASVSSIKVNGADAIAQALSAGTIKQGAPSTNRVVTDSAGKVLGYKGGFAYRDVLAAFEYTPSPRLPIAVQVNVVQNTAAASNDRTGVWADVRAGRLSQPHDVQASWTLFRIERDAVVGALNEQDLRAATNVVNHRVALTYQWRANATLGAGLWIGHLLDATLTGKLTPPDVKTACTTAPFTGCSDPLLKRAQIDLSYKF